MLRYQHPIVCIAAAVLLSGCASRASFRHAEAPTHASVYDITVPASLGSGYRIAQVDGKEVERAESNIHTVAPWAVVPPGQHTLSLEPVEGAAGTPTTLSAKFVAGKSYRLEQNGAGSVTLAEENRVVPPDRTD
jgi:hypothetical protein